MFANSSMDEMSIWYYPIGNKSSLIVGETVFAVGYNDDFIIAKSHPKGNRDMTAYHIISIVSCKVDPKESVGLTLNQFESRRTQLSVPKGLDFTIIYDELQ